MANLGEAARLRGDYDKAVARYLEALDISPEVGDRDTAALVLANLGGAYVGLGRYRQAVASLQASLEVFETTGRREYLSEAKRFLAEAYLGMDDPEPAEQWASAALEDGRAAGNPEQVGHAWRVLGLASARLGRPTVVAGESVGADGCFARGVGEFAGAERDQAVALADQARFTSAHDSSLAQELWDQALRTLAPLGLEGLAGRLE